MPSTAKQIIAQQTKELQKDLRSLRAYIMSAGDQEFDPSQIKHINQLTAEMWNNYLVAQLQTATNLHFVPTYTQAVQKLSSVQHTKDNPAIDAAIENAKRTHNTKQAEELSIEKKILSTKHKGPATIDYNYFDYNNLQTHSVPAVKEHVKELMQIANKAYVDNPDSTHALLYKEYFEALEAGFIRLEETEKLLHLMQVPDNDPKAVYLVASVFCTTVALILIAPFVIAGSTLGAGMLFGNKMLSAWRNNSADTTQGQQAWVSEQMQQLTALTGPFALGAGIGSLVGLATGLPLMAAASKHSLKKATNKQYAIKNDLLHSIDALHANITDTRPTSYIAIIADNLESLFKYPAQQSKILAIESNSLPPGLIADLKLLFTLHLDEFEQAINLAKKDSDFEGVEALKRMLSVLHNEFKELSSLVNAKQQDKPAIYSAIGKILNKADRQQILPKKTAASPNLLVGDYLRQTSLAKSKKVVIDRLRKNIPRL